MTRHIAIIGSGPSGIYAAERLARIAPDDRIDVIDSLPVPFGLVRYGVAPDHQSTKAVTRVLGRALSRDNVGFLGNVTVGNDVTLDELRLFYDALILATGAPKDRRLGLPGEDLPGVHGSGALVGWINGHPACSGLNIDLAGVSQIVIVGVGNVALDVARVFAKSPDEMAAADVSPELAQQLATMPLTTVTLLGRRGPEDARFTALELSEMGELTSAQPIVDPCSMPKQAADDPKPLSILRSYSQTARDHRPVVVDFRFRTRPLAFEGNNTLTGVRIAATDGAEVVLPAQLAVTCIGYDGIACDRLEPSAGIIANQDGKVEDGIYVVGWAKRGSTGTIPTNRPESHAVADRVIAETSAGTRKGSDGLVDLIVGRGGRIVGFGDWQRIDAAEIERATGDRPRHKFQTVAEMLAAADR